MPTIYMRNDISKQELQILQFRISSCAFDGGDGGDGDSD